MFVGLLNLFPVWDSAIVGPCPIAEELEYKVWCCVLFRIAAVSFLNTVPLVEGLAVDAPQSHTLLWDIPSRLKKFIAQGQADVALLPVAEIFGPEIGGILPVAGIACRGAVDSVKLFNRGDLGKITQVAADRGSRSSVALLKILLAETHGLKPSFTEINPEVGRLPERTEGILIIGDRCFQYEKYLRETGNANIRTWDLGQMWWDLTGLPFVFATWALAAEFTRKAGADGVADLRTLLMEARRYGEGNLTRLAEREAAAGRLGHKGYATAAAIDYYFRESLCFNIGAAELEGIGRFHQLGVQHGILPAGPMPEIL